jgi:hypothetical protein
MSPFRLCSYLIVVPAFAISQSLQDFTGPLGILSLTLLQCAIYHAVFNPKADAAWLLLEVAYFCLLGQFADCAAHFGVVSPSFPPANYVNLTAPSSYALKTSSLVLMPVLVCTYGIVALRSHRFYRRQSRPVLRGMIAGTLSLGMAFFCMHAVLIYWETRRY